MHSVTRNVHTVMHAHGRAFLGVSGKKSGRENLATMTARFVYSVGYVSVFLINPV